MPTELDELSRKIMQMEIEEAALKKETDHLSQDRLADLQKELAELHDTFASQKAQWENEKASVDRLSSLREEIESLHRQIQDAQQKYDLIRRRSSSTENCFRSWKRSWRPRRKR